MKERRFVGPLLFWGIMALMALGVLLLVIGLRYSHQRSEDFAQRTLDQVIAVTGTEIDASLNDYAGDLRREAAFIGQYDSIPLDALLERWRPLISTRWAIIAVHQSNTFGADLSLLRKDGQWEVRTRDTTLANMPLPSPPQGNADGPVDFGFRWVQSPSHDPRQAIWFSRALEDRTGEPVWSSDTDTTKGTLHHLSLLIRPRSEDEPFRVIAFTIDAKLALSAVQRGTEDEDMSPILIDSDGKDLIGLTDSTPSPLREAAVLNWRNAPVRSMYKGKAGDRSFHALIVPHYLNGETLHVGGVVADDVVDGWMRPERFALGTFTVFLVLMAMMLGWSYIRRLRDSDLLRQQQKRTRSRERELAKALGERNVLDREVHHRVKNNLQVVSSLLNLQAQRLPDGSTKAEFMRGKRRIDAMALVHHKLYGMQDLRTIRLQDLFQQLANAVSALHEPGSRSVSHAVDTAGIVSDPDTAIELGIILCELLDNCHHHAFPFATGGHIEVTVRRLNDEEFKLTVKDNGKGMDEGSRNDPSKLGLEIVEALAGQLDGTFMMRPRQDKDSTGVAFEVQFKMLHPVG